MEDFEINILRRNGNWKTSGVNSSPDGLTTQKIEIENSGVISLSVNMLGSYNATNAACALAASQFLGLSIPASLESLKNVRPIPGRLEKVSIASPGTAFVDYAHTPDAVSTVLTVIKTANPEKIITVIGCGGDRDSSKRALMGKALHDGADVAIFTSDNPRSEKADAILVQMTLGLDIQEPSAIIEDRAEAIRAAVNEAQEGDLVLVLGKGHEKGQEINGVVHPFDDRVELARAIEDKK